MLRPSVVVDRPEVKTRTRLMSKARWAPGDDDESDAIADARSKVVDIFKGIASDRRIVSSGSYMVFSLK